MRKYGLGIRGRLVLCFSCFLVFILIVIWLFQFFLLDTFYMRAKIRELDDAALAIKEAAETGTEQQVAYDLAYRYRLCVRVINVSDSSLGDETFSIENSAVCMIHHMPRDVLYSYYLKALANGGEYSYQFKPGDFIEKDSDDSPDNVQISRSRGIKKLFGGGANSYNQIIFVCDIRGNDGSSTALFLNTEFSPLNATTVTSTPSLPGRS